MKILLLGRNGQVGWELARLFSESNHTLLSYNSSELNLTDLQQLKSEVCRQQPEIIINAAAYTAVDKAEEEQEASFAINALAPKVLAELAGKMNIPLIHISTDYVFDGLKTGCYLEDDAVGPKSEYGYSKLAGEQFIVNALPQHIIIRTSWVFGYHGNNFVKTMLNLANKPELSIVEDQKGSPTYSEDIAKLIIRLVNCFIMKGTLDWGIYHYTGDEQTTWFDFAAVIFKKAQEHHLIANSPNLLPIPTSQYPTPAKRPFNSCLSLDKIAKYGDLDNSWRDGLDRMLIQLKNDDI
ncbi:dTDP-4-dehydrorhamnose reductase [Colwelliaceae bacterium 6441]